MGVSMVCFFVLSLEARGCHGTSGSFASQHFLNPSFHMFEYVVSSLCVFICVCGCVGARLCTGACLGCVCVCVCSCGHTCATVSPSIFLESGWLIIHQYISRLASPSLLPVSASHPVIGELGLQMFIASLGFPMSSRDLTSSSHT